VDVVESIIAVSPDDRERCDDNNRNQNDAGGGPCRQWEPTIWTDLFNLLPSVQRIVRVKSVLNALLRFGSGEESSKEGLRTKSEKRS
jgi:hypothetical protein